jgi:hypothetical protein
MRRCRFGEGIKWGQRGGRDVRLVPCRGAGGGGLAKEDAVKAGRVATVLLCSSVDLGHGGAGSKDGEAGVHLCFAETRSRAGRRVVAAAAHIWESKGAAKGRMFIPLQKSKFSKFLSCNFSKEP